MTSKKMFERLGFKLYTDNELLKCYKIKHNKNVKDDDTLNWDYIIFDIKNKTYTVDIMIANIDTKLHKAIHKQCQELGWLDD